MLNSGLDLGQTSYDIVIGRWDDIIFLYISKMTLPFCSDLAWSCPVTLSCSTNQKIGLLLGRTVSLLTNGALASALVHFLTILAKCRTYESGAIYAFLYYMYLTIHWLLFCVTCRLGTPSHPQSSNRLWAQVPGAVWRECTVDNT